MSAICQNFVQNAWKKDLCSNCFKSKDEHSLTRPKPVAIVSSERVESIIKANTKSKTKLNVVFTKELIEIIGYGGEDWSDKEDDDCEHMEEDEEEDCDTDYDEDIQFSDDDQELIKLTKTNTDFNANLLNETIENNKKNFTNLMLGKPQLDSEGRKQTLLVSVTPFGQQDNQNTQNNNKNKSNNTIINNNNNKTSQIPIAKSNKETLVEAKSNVVLTSYSKNDETAKEEKSLLEEISETLENSKNPIQIVTRKKTQKDIILNVTKPDSNKENINKLTTEATNEKLKEIKLKSNIPERKIGITRTPVIKSQEKPAIYQTSVAKIELLNSRNLKLSNSKENLTSNNKTIKSEFNRIIKSEQNTNNKNVDEDGDEKKDSMENEKKMAVEEEIERKAETVEKVIQIDKVPEGLPPQIPKFNNIPQTREQAGEPDGKADSDDTQEPPALPLTPPPPLESQLESPTSFLHGNLSMYDKPRVPSKPVPPPKISPSESPILATFNPVESRNSEETVVKLTKHDSNGSDIAKASNKRRAPKPPPQLEASEAVIFNRNSMGGVSLDSSLKETPNRKYRDEDLTLEHTSRATLSMSIDNLNDDKKKDKRARFSLKKFLRMGSKTDALKIQHQEIPRLDETDHHSSNKPRLVIVHPLDLNGAKVEVVAKPLQNNNNNNNNKSSSSNEYAVPNVIINQESYASRGPKPLPPPRNLDDWKPLPHPPKSAEIIYKQKQFSSKDSINNKKVDTVYANIGEVRSAITPNKPQRTASMREREALQQQQHHHHQQQLQKQQRNEKRKNVENYEPIGLLRKEPSENVYDYINSGRSSSPESDSTPDKNSPINKNGRLINGQRAGSSIDVSGDYFKYQNIPRSVSLTYCGSETESEIYSPYSFYGSETEIAEDDVDWTGQNGRTYKLRSRKGRSIVHKNLEDNYGAVIVANHEALAQVLENIQHTTAVQPALRGLKTLSNLRWSDFTIKSTTSPLLVGSRTFHQATWNAQHVTLMISFGQVPTTSLSLGNFVLNPITEFNDLIPTKYLPHQQENVNHTQATVAVLPWLQVNTIQSYSEFLKNRAQNDETNKEAMFGLLQLINALKLLQAQGIEELPLSLTSFILCRDMERDVHNRLCVLQGLGEDLTRKQKEDKMGSLCMCALTALKLLMPFCKYTPLIQSLLNNERAVSLTQVKSILEFSLWGPSDVALGTTIKDRELALQRWLDLQRATVLHGLVCTKIQLTVYEECHLLFLVRSSVKMMCDASLLLESSNKQNFVQNGRK